MKALYRPKRILSLLLTLCLVLALMPALGSPASAGFTTTPVTLGSSSNGQTLTAGYIYRVTSTTVNINTNANVTGVGGNKNGLTLPSSGTVVIYIAPGCTLNVYGQNGSGATGGGAAILLPQNTTLIVTGGGTLNAYGGKAGNGTAGTKGYNGGSGSTNRSQGAAGGAGGGGGGAGIGTNGGSGGGGGDGGNWNTGSYYGKVGTVGSSAAAAGTIYKFGTVTVNGRGGAVGTAGSGGAAGSWQSSGDAGGGGGGGGGRGGSGANIGAGGTGGGGGGGGSSADSGWGGSGGGGGGYGGGAGTAGTGSGNNSAYAGNNGTASTSSSGAAGGVANGSGKSTYGGAGAYGGVSGSARSYATGTNSNVQYAVTRNGNGGTSPASINMTYGLASGLGTTSRTGHAFKGWYDSTASNALQITNNAGTLLANKAGYTDSQGAWICARATTLYAHWTANTYNVSFDANGGTGTMTQQPFTYGVSQALKENAFTKQGYTFRGWATSLANAKNGTVAHTDGKSISITETTTLYAVWKGDPVSISLIAGRILNNATAADTQATVNLDEAFTESIGTLPATATHDFAGYYSKPDGAGTQYFTATGAPTSAKWTDAGTNPRLYAHWTQKPLAASLQNGSFEFPVATNWNQMYNANTTQGIVWKTTASDYMIELGRPGLNRTSAKSAYYTSYAAEGEQFAELNANKVGSLYQSIDTSGAIGETLIWNLSHKGRSGTDTMQVWIGEPTAVTKAIKQYIADGNKVGTKTRALIGALGSGGILQAECKSGNNGWTEYSGEYTVPVGQNETMFAFISVAASGNNVSYGNLLDNIYFGRAADRPTDTVPVTVNPPVGGSANVLIDGAALGVAEGTSSTTIHAPVGSKVSVSGFPNSSDYTTIGAIQKVGSATSFTPAADGKVDINITLSKGNPVEVNVLFAKKGYVTLDPNGGTYKGSSGEVKMSLDGNTDTTELLPDAAEKTGYRFDGWQVVTPGNALAAVTKVVYEAASDGTAYMVAYNGGSEVCRVETASSGMILIAGYSIPTVPTQTVKLSLDGGKVEGLPETGDEITLVLDASLFAAGASAGQAILPTPLKEGYAFKHWRLDEATAYDDGTALSYRVNTDFTANWGIGAGDYSRSTGEAVTLTAVWEGDTVTLGLSGGSGDDIADKNHDFGTTQAGYSFPEGESLSVTVANSGTKAAETVAVSFSGGATGAFTADPANLTDIAVGGSGSFMVYPKDGLAAGSYSETVTVEAGGSSVSFTVSFTVTNPGVTLHLNGGALKASGITEYAPDSPIDLPTAELITKTGYTFEGWYEEAGFQTGPVTQTPATGRGPMDYYAKWAVCTHDAASAAATCTEGAECACGVSVPAKGHDYSGGYVHDSGTESCVSLGSQTAVCQNAPDDRTHDHTIEETESSYLQNHNWGTGWQDYSPSTCEATGLQSRECGSCARIEYQETDPSGHEWDSGEVTAPATCTVDGLKTFLCLQDSSHKKTEAIRAEGHAFPADEPWIHDNNPAGHWHKCDNCDASDEMKPHDFNEEDSADLTVAIVCSDCGYVLRAARLEPVFADKDQSVTYSGSPIATDSATYFTTTSNGDKTFRITGGTGSGRISADGTLTVTEVGSFIIEVTTALTDDYVSDTDTFTLTVTKGERSLTNPGTTRESGVDAEDGEVSGLPAGDYRYRPKDGDSWVPVTVGSDGKIGPLPPGEYEIYREGDELYSDSAAVTVTILECYEIRWNLGGGGWLNSFNAPETYYQDGAYTFTLPGSANIAREGFSFTDWYTSLERDQKAANISSATTGDLFFVAGWQGDIYSITKDASDTNGSFTVTNTQGEEITTAGFQDRVVITAVPESGYAVDTVTVIKADSSEASVNGSDGSYWFSMPSGNATVKVTFKPAYILSGKVTIVAPVTGEAPATTGSVTDTTPPNTSASVESVAWSPELNSAGKFAEKALYTATVVLKPGTDLLFDDSFAAAAVNGRITDTEVSPDGATATVIIEFDATDEKTVTGIADKSVFDSEDEKGAYYTYMSGDKLKTDEVIIEISYSDGTKEEVRLSDLIEDGADVLIGGGDFDADSNVLKKTDHSGKDVTVEYGGESVKIGTLTVYNPPIPHLTALYDMTVSSTEVTGKTDATVTKQDNDYDVTLTVSGRDGPLLQSSESATKAWSEIALEDLTPGERYTMTLTATDTVTNCAYSYVSTFTAPNYVPITPNDPDDPVHDLPGTITADGNRVVWVSLYRGEELLGTQKATMGAVVEGKTTYTFNFKDTRPGIYNLVVDNGLWLVTHGAILPEDGVLDPPIVVDMGSGYTQSVIEHTADAPVVVAEGLPKLFEDSSIYTGPKETPGTDQYIVENNGMIEIRLIVEGEKAVISDDKSLLSDLASEEGKVAGAYMDLSLVKSVYPIIGGEASRETALTDVSPRLLVLTVDIPPSVQGKSGLAIARVHHNPADPDKPTVELLKTIDDESVTVTDGVPDGECCAISEDGKIATLWLSRFSPYAFIHDADYGSSENNLVIRDAVGGDVRPFPQNPSRGESVTLTPQPDKGFVFGDIAIKDEDGRDIPYTTDENGNIRFTMPEGKVTVTPRFKRSFDVSDILNTTDHMAYMQGDDKGSFKPENNMTRAEMAQMFYNLLIDQNVEIKESFPDVPENAWYAKAVNVMASLGIVTGYPNGDFGPGDYITRAQFAAVVVRFTRFAEASESAGRFTDVPKSHWAYSEIGLAYEFGFINGTNADMTLFEPDRCITRAEAATMTNSILGRSPDRSAIDTWDTLRKFPDLSNQSWYWYNVMEAVNGHDYSREDGTEKEIWVK